MQENTAETQIITENIENDEGFKKFKEMIIQGLQNTEKQIKNGQYSDMDIVFTDLKRKYKL